jgi:hypothetical protein
MRLARPEPWDRQWKNGPIAAVAGPERDTSVGAKAQISCLFQNCYGFFEKAS